MDSSGNEIQLTNTSALCLMAGTSASSFPVCHFYNTTTSVWETTGMVREVHGGVTYCRSSPLTDFSTNPPPPPVTCDASVAPTNGGSGNCSSSLVSSRGQPSPV